jgi:hypothetical protein
MLGNSWSPVKEGKMDPLSFFLLCPSSGERSAPSPAAQFATCLSQTPKEAKKEPFLPQRGRWQVDVKTEGMLMMKKERQTEVILELSHPLPTNLVETE